MQHIRTPKLEHQNSNTNTGTRNAARRCNNDRECLPDDGPCMGPSYSGPSKTCALDRSIRCQTDAECGSKAPCDGGKTCSKNRAQLCFTDEHCKPDMGVCNSGRTCSLDPNTPCDADIDCKPDKGVCGKRDSGSKTCVKDRSIKCQTDAECGDKAPCESENDKECCACFPYNPDLRWPDVRGSPIVTDMGNPEYQWGKRGDKNPNNPVGRMNQPRPECCPCTLERDARECLFSHFTYSEVSLVSLIHNL